MFYFSTPQFFADYKRRDVLTKLSKNYDIFTNY